MPPPLDLPEPPTQATLALARAQLATLTDASKALEHKIFDARDALSRLIDERQAAIRDMERELALLDDALALARAYVAPIKRLPHELLRHVFVLVFDDCAWSAWVLAAVCALWRRVALAMPVIWSKIRLVTTQAASAETIRLWLERSGRTVPLDIEILLKSSPGPVHSALLDGLSRRRYLSVPHAVAGDPWVPGAPGWATPPPPLTHGGAGGMHLQLTVQVPVPVMVPANDGGGGAAAGLPLPPDAPHTHAHGHEWEIPPLLVGSSDQQVQQQQQQQQQRNGPLSQQRLRKNMHWGHIAFYYLVEQMHRWERRYCMPGETHPW
ncbi:hypothetical protein FKP32DRAFT_1685288 [Trametes sanguinea]|nr:hypothetical protein FKP32DRAFT_1685288 [Trametes sanguinea]